MVFLPINNKHHRLGLDSTKNECLHFFYGSCALFMRPTSTDFSKFFFKTGFQALFTHLKIILVQYFQFSAISGIQTEP